MAGQQCVDNTDFSVVNGVLSKRTHGARMLNDVTIREVPSGGPDDLDNPVFEWTVPGYDTLDYVRGDAVVPEISNARFIVAKPGLYHISAGYGDNDFQANDGAKLYLTIYVGGASVMRGDSYKVGGQKAWVTVAGDVEIPAGATVRISYAVGLCNPPPPPAPPVCGRSDHFLYPDQRNFFAIHRIGGLN